MCRCAIFIGIIQSNMFLIAEQQGDQSSSGEGPSPIRSGEEGGSTEGKGAQSAEGECDRVAEEITWMFSFENMHWIFFFTAIAEALWKLNVYCYGYASRALVYGKHLAF